MKVVLALSMASFATTASAKNQLPHNLLRTIVKSDSEATRSASCGVEILNSINDKPFISEAESGTYTVGFRIVGDGTGSASGKIQGYFEHSSADTGTISLTMDGFDGLAATFKGAPYEDEYLSQYCPDGFTGRVGFIQNECETFDTPEVMTAERPSNCFFSMDIKGVCC